MKLIATPRRLFVTPYRLLWLFICLGQILNVTAQPASTGTLTGVVKNQATGALLTSARISIEGTDISVIADRGGRYSVNAPAGEQTFVVTYAGLDDLRTVVTVAPQSETTKDFALTSSIYAMEEFVVEGNREGMSAAIQQQRESMSTRSVASIDAFGNPGSAVGELIMRLPGVAVDLGAGGEPGAIYIRGMGQDFSSLLIDGNQLAVSGGTSVSSLNVYLGQVSSSNIESLEVIKSATPDMDGNAIAGYMNLKTKRAFDRAPGRLITLSAGTTWADTRQDSSVPGKDKPLLDLFSVNYSDVLSVFGGKNNLGIFATLTESATQNRTAEFGPRLSVANATAYFIAPPAASGEIQPLLRGYAAGHWGADSVATPTYNLGFNVDYKLSNRTVLYFKSSFSYGKNANDAAPSYFRMRLNVPQAASSFMAGSTYDLVTTNPVGNVQLESTLYIRENVSYSLSSGVEHSFFAKTGKLNIDTSYSSAKTGYPELNNAYAQITGVGFQIDRRDRDIWHPAVTQISGPNWSDPANYRVQAAETSRIVYSAPVERMAVSTDYTQKLDLPVEASIKTGVKFGRLDAKQDRDLRYYTYSGPATFPASTGGITPYLGYTMKMSDSHYGPFPFLQLPTTGRTGDIWANPSNFTESASNIWNTIVNSWLNDAAFEEEIISAYAMGNLKLGKLRILGGVRFEDTRTSGTSYVRVINANNTNLATATPEVNAARARDNFRGEVTQGTNYHNVFPGIHFVYLFAKNTQARLEYNTTISRPSPANLLPVIFPNESNQTLSAGNPALKPYTSDNFDLGVEHYFKWSGQLSAGVFLKEIKNYFRTFQSTVPSGPDNGFGGQYAGYLLSQNRNVGQARIRGAELSYRQQFSFLPRALRGLGAYANYTYLDTYGDFGAATGTTTRLPTLSPHVMNGGVMYRGYGFDAGLYVNYRGEFFKSTTTGSHGTGGMPGTTIFDVYEDSRLIYDLKLKYSFNRRYTVNFDIYNLTNEFSVQEVIKVFGRKVPAYGNTNGTIYRASITARF